MHYMKAQYAFVVYTCSSILDLEGFVRAFESQMSCVTVSSRKKTRVFSQFYGSRVVHDGQVHYYVIVRFDRMVYFDVYQPWRMFQLDGDDEQDNADNADNADDSRKGCRGRVRVHFPYVRDVAKRRGSRKNPSIKDVREFVGHV